jgi:hypothetical protein
MYESEKIKEAEYFYSQMLKEISDRDRFKFNLSAFLSAGRSVLQYAREEAQSKPGGLGWYDAQVTANKITGFFKDKRDVNIHAEPVAVQANVSVGLTATLHVSESLSMVIRDPQGNVKGEYYSEPAQTPPLMDQPSTIDVRYVFDDWNGSEDIPTLCKQYLKELEVVVADGKARSFLSL